jgi:hypothetical protein
MWATIRANFLRALVERRIDKWLVEESRNTAEVMTKFHQLNDISAFAEFLDKKVKEEESAALGHNGGGFFVSFRGGIDV